MKNFKTLLLGSFFVICFSTLVYATCPTTDCGSDCGSGGQGCQITQWENGRICSTTICHGKRGDIE